MPAQFELSKLSVRQFAERFRSEMIPLSNTFSYFCASLPMSDEDLKEYLEERGAAQNFHPPGPLYRKVEGQGRDVFGLHLH
jgi:hypothetical protein